MRKKTKQRIRKITCAAVICAMVSPSVGAAAVQAADAPEGGAVQKEETVYVFTDASGETTQVLVNDRLKNENGVFNESKFVVLATQFLRTLDRENILSASAEMLELGIISDEKM